MLKNNCDDILHSVKSAGECTSATSFYSFDSADETGDELSSRPGDITEGSEEGEIHDSEVDEEKCPSPKQNESNASSLQPPQNTVELGPMFVPRNYKYFEHDDRCDLDVDSDGACKKVKDFNEWTHDKFDPILQAPKSVTELIETYGRDIRLCQPDELENFIPARTRPAKNRRLLARHQNVSVYVDAAFSRLKDEQVNSPNKKVYSRKNRDSQLRERNYSKPPPRQASIRPINNHDSNIYKSKEASDNYDKVKKEVDVESLVVFEENWDENEITSCKTSLRHVKDLNDNESKENVEQLNFVSGSEDSEAEPKNVKKGLSLKSFNSKYNAQERSPRKPKCYSSTKDKLNSKYHTLGKCLNYLENEDNSQIQAKENQASQYKINSKSESTDIQTAVASLDQICPATAREEKSENVIKFFPKKITTVCEKESDCPRVPDNMCLSQTPEKSNIGNYKGAQWSSTHSLSKFLRDRPTDPPRKPRIEISLGTSSSKKSEEKNSYELSTKVFYNSQNNKEDATLQNSEEKESYASDIAYLVPSSSGIVGSSDNRDVEDQSQMFEGFLVPDAVPSSSFSEDFYSYESSYNSEIVFNGNEFSAPVPPYPSELLLSHDAVAPQFMMESSMVQHYSPTYSVPYQMSVSPQRNMWVSFHDHHMYSSNIPFYQNRVALKPIGRGHLLRQQTSVANLSIAHRPVRIPCNVNNYAIADWTRMTNPPQPRHPPHVIPQRTHVASELYADPGTPIVVTNASVSGPPRQSYVAGELYAVPDTPNLETNATASGSNVGLPDMGLSTEEQLAAANSHAFFSKFAQAKGESSKSSADPAPRKLNPKRYSVQRRLNRDNTSKNP